MFNYIISNVKNRCKINTLKILFSTEISFMKYFNPLCLCVRETPKRVLHKQLRSKQCGISSGSKGKKDLQTKLIFFVKSITWNPRYVQLAIPSLLYQTKRKKSLVYKGLMNNEQCIIRTAKMVIII